MIKVVQAMDTIALHACPTCLEKDFGFGFTAATEWEVWQLKSTPLRHRRCRHNRRHNTQP